MLRYVRARTRYSVWQALVRLRQYIRAWILRQTAVLLGGGVVLAFVPYMLITSATRITVQFQVTFRLFFFDPSIFSTRICGYIFGATGIAR